MRIALVSAALAAVGLLATPVAAVFSDQVYHTERLALSLTAAGEAADHPVPLSAQVVNIHPNGPVNGATTPTLITSCAKAGMPTSRVRTNIAASLFMDASSTILRLGCRVAGIGDVSSDRWSVRCGTSLVERTRSLADGPECI